MMDAATQNLCPVTLESVGNSPDMQLPQTRVLVQVQVALGLPPSCLPPWRTADRGLLTDWSE